MADGSDIDGVERSGARCREADRREATCELTTVERSRGRWMDSEAANDGREQRRQRRERRRRALRSILYRCGRETQHSPITSPISLSLLLCDRHLTSSHSHHSSG